MQQEDTKSLNADVHTIPVPKSLRLNGSELSADDTQCFASNADIDGKVGIFDTVGGNSVLIHDPSPQLNAGWNALIPRFANNGTANRMADSAADNLKDLEVIINRHSSNKPQ